jgi:putative restriction endonuclease
MSEAGLDARLRAAAFEHVSRLSAVRGELTSEDLKAGFFVDGERVPLINPQRGIFKPQRMTHLLSIRTVIPRRGARVWYDDQLNVHRQIYEGQEGVEYAFMGQDPDAAENRWLREAFERSIPVIYFLGVAPGRYQAIAPTFVANWQAFALKAQLVFGDPLEPRPSLPETAVDRRYALRQVKTRLHQASFRSAVIDAYGGRCALTRLPEQRLLDAAHIVPDGHSRWGQPVVPNGMPLSKLHHAAFDAQLIGVDPDFVIHVSDRLLDQQDGPLLESIKALAGQQILLPKRREDWPDKSRLEHRFDLFRRGP